jgi:hypothetical protein
MKMIQSNVQHTDTIRTGQNIKKLKYQSEVRRLDGQGKFLLVLASKIILGFESREASDHIFLSH